MRITLLAVAAVLLAGCTSEPEAAPTQAPAVQTTVEQPAGTGPTCANANSSVVGKALNLRLQGQRETVDKAVTTCNYVGAGMPVEVRFTTGATAASFAEGRPEKAKVVEGLFDEAYEASAGGAETVQHTVVARKGKTQIAVVSPAGVEPSKKLITELFSRV